MIARIRATTNKIWMSPPKKWPTSPNTHKAKRIITTIQTQLGILPSFYLPVLTAVSEREIFLPVEVPDKSHYANNDEINTDYVI
jgi:hypothetical protein